MTVRRFAILLWGVALALGLPDARAQDQQEIRFRTTKLADNVYMLAGAGGNLALCVGEDGGFLVDTEYAGLHDKLVAAVKEISEQPIRYAVNTHWHFDHVGGNEKFGTEGVILIAHENVRERLSSDQVIGTFNREVPASPPVARPIVTFSDRLTLHLNGEVIRIIHVPPAHTDGDSFVHFVNANVLHTGDVLFNGMYPFIDSATGGSIDGMIAAVDRALKLVNEETKIVPGHGPPANRDDLRKYRSMLTTVRDRVKALIDAGKSRAEIIAAKPTEDLDAEWAKSFGPDEWVGIVYDGLVRAKD